MSAGSPEHRPALVLVSGDTDSLHSWLYLWTVRFQNLEGLCSSADPGDHHSGLLSEGLRACEHVTLFPVPVPGDSVQDIKGDPGLCILTRVR